MLLDELKAIVSDKIKGERQQNVEIIGTFWHFRPTRIPM